MAEKRSGTAAGFEYDPATKAVRSNDNVGDAALYGDNASSSSDGDNMGSDGAAVNAMYEDMLFDLSYTNSQINETVICGVNPIFAQLVRNACIRTKEDATHLQRVLDAIDTCNLFITEKGKDAFRSVKRMANSFPANVDTDMMTNAANISLMGHREKLNLLESRDLPASLIMQQNFGNITADDISPQNVKQPVKKSKQIVCDSGDEDSDESCDESSDDKSCDNIEVKTNKDHCFKCQKYAKLILAAEPGYTISHWHLSDDCKLQGLYNKDTDAYLNDKYPNWEALETHQWVEHYHNDVIDTWNELTAMSRKNVRVQKADKNVKIAKTKAAKAAKAKAKTAKAAKAKAAKANAKVKTATSNTQTFSRRTNKRRTSQTRLFENESFVPGCGILKRSGYDHTVDRRIDMEPMYLTDTSDESDDEIIDERIYYESGSDSDDYSY